MRSKVILGGVQCEIIKLDNIPNTSNTSLSHGKNMWHLLSQQFWSIQYSIILDIHHTAQRNSNKNFFPRGRFPSPWPLAPHCLCNPVLLSALWLRLSLWLRLFQIPPTAEDTWHLSSVPGLRHIVWCPPVPSLSRQTNFLLFKGWALLSTCTTFSLWSEKQKEWGCLGGGEGQWFVLWEKGTMKLTPTFSESLWDTRSLTAQL